jgi:hypothetical protein
MPGLVIMVLRVPRKNNEASSPPRMDAFGHGFTASTACDSASSERCLQTVSERTRNSRAEQHDSERDDGRVSGREHLPIAR